MFSRLADHVGPERTAAQGMGEHWVRLIEEYSTLALTYESDRLSALSGLAKMWQSQGAGQYLAGALEGEYS